MIKYGITGNIASGKSTVENIIKAYGYSVLDTDIVAHEFLNCDEVKELFKNNDVFDDGKISRTKLGQLVFSNNEYLKKLEEIIHPKVKEKITDFFKKHSCEKAVFVSVPQLFETNMEKMFDKIIFVYADDSIRENRLVKRNNYTKEYAQKRMSAQISQEQKISRADIVIYNTSSEKFLEKEVTTKLAL